MTVKLKLAGQMLECPVCWEKFVRYCQLVHCDGEPYWSVSDEIFAEELAKFNASVHFGKNNYVEFSTAQDRLLFILRWT